MINYVLRLHDSEFERTKPQMQNMMNSSHPILFRDVHGRMFALVHGSKSKGFINGMTADDIRKYASTHSNIAEFEMLYIISCYSATNDINTKYTKFFTLTNYPVFYTGFSEDEVYDDYAILFSIVDESSEESINRDILHASRSLAITLNISEEAAKEIIVNGTYNEE